MVPYYQIRHERQIVGLEGPDLAGQRRRQLMTGARDTTRDSIQQFDSTQFHVASESRPGAYYEINLDQSTCNCPDFPRSRFCKHLAAINVHFPHLCKQESSSPTAPCDPEFGGLLNPPDRVLTPEIRRTSSPQEGLQKLIQDIKSLSHQLYDKISDLTDESVPGVMEAIRSVKYSLTAAIASTQGSRALPNKENVPPNQNSWTETAERMGTKRAPKRRRLPDEHGLTARSIGVPKGKRKCLYTDPYAGGGRSGTRAKPDALSAAANARARARARTRSPVPPPNAPPNSLPFPTASPPSPSAFPPAPTAYIPSGFAFTPGPSASHALPPVSTNSHGPGTAPCVPPPFGAWDPVLAHAAPFASASYLSHYRIT